MKKKRIIRIIYSLMLFVALFALFAWFYYQPQQPNMALFCSLAAGMLEVNFLIALFFVYKNFEEKGR